MSPSGTSSLRDPAGDARPVDAALRFLADRLEVVVLVAIVVAPQLFPGTLPPWLYGFGLVSGAFLALHALGVILVYRSNQIINFAQVQVGVVAGALFAMLVQYRPILRAFITICPGCRVTGRLIDVNYWISLMLAAAAAVLLSFAVYIFVVKRFAKASRLVLTVATIFLAQLLGGVRGLLPTLLLTEDQRQAGEALEPVPPPFDWSFTWDGTRFDTARVLLVLSAVVALSLLIAYFRLSRSGVAILAAGERPARAATVGIKVDAMSGRVWMMAGGLSGVAGIVSATLNAPGDAALDISGTVRILAVALIAGMANLALAAVAAVAVGLLIQSVVFSYGTDVLLDGVLFVVIALVLSVQNRRGSAGDVEQASEWVAARQVRPVPGELRSLAVVRGWRRAGAALVAIVVLGLPWALAGPQVTAASLVVIFAMASMSLLVVTGWVGHISLGQFAISAVAAYSVAVLRLPFLLALPVGALVGAATAVAVGFPSLRLRGLYLAVITLAFAVAVPIVVLSPRYLGRHLPDTIERPALLGIDLDDGRTFYYVALLLLVMVVIALSGVRRSHGARALIAGRDNPAAAQALGINLVRARLQGYALAGAVAGLAGALYAFYQYGVRSTSFAADVSITIFVLAVIGGLGSVAGPLMGAAYYGVLTIGGASPVVQLLATGGGGLMLLLFLPGGLGQAVFSIRDGLLRRVAERLDIAVPSLVADVTREGRRRVAIAPRRPRGGGAVVLPTRYRLDDQWGLDGGNRGLEAQSEQAAARRRRELISEPGGG